MIKASANFESSVLIIIFALSMSNLCCCLSLHCSIKNNASFSYRQTVRFALSGPTCLSFPSAKSSTVKACHSSCSRTRHYCPTPSSTQLSKASFRTSFLIPTCTVFTASASVLPPLLPPMVLRTPSSRRQGDGRAKSTRDTYALLLLLVKSSIF
ncbi:hypothetical protein RvY_03792 [Ramazzottius varieornatus]|uniref:Secreted protein n=1 Tax=Ramazzottius varieornatus TaxID=947166 RepID=A0A1D1UPC4_RAMVA|nr:hypothetical protein RvY_03792 [Ramazzottius varieornatus]